MSIEATLKEREGQHGDFRINGAIGQELKKVLRDSKGWDTLSAYQKEALDMMVSKMARILSGNPDFEDHWHDIAGYATLVEKILRGEYATKART
jgi:hypothetical protein